MNDDVRAVLSDIIRTEGGEVTAQPQRLQALLTERCGSSKLEIDLLVSAAEDGVPDALSGSSDGPPTEASERLARQLEASRGIDYHQARWAVDSWAMGLGIAGSSPTEVAVPMPPPAGSPVVPPPGEGSSLLLPPAGPPRPPPPPVANPPGHGAPPPGPPSGPTPDSKWLLIGGGVVIGVIAIVVVLVLALSGGKGNGKPTATPTTVTPTTVTPTTGPRSTTTPPTTLTPTTQPTAPEAVLISRVPISYRATCKVLAEQDKRDDFRNIPAITCDPNATVSVFFYQLPNATVMNDEYHSLVSANTLPDTTCDPNRNANFRAASTYTTGSTERGKALCYVGTDNTARMEWTDDALNTYGSIAANDSPPNRQTIYQFWVDNGALLR